MTDIKKIEKEILYHKNLYYSGRAKISDHEFDKLESELKAIDPNNPVLYMVGSKQLSNKVPHQNKMLSLQKTYIKEDLYKWMGEESILSTEKIDGSSCSLIYMHNELILAKTRGDGSFGENITLKIEQLSDVPKKINIANNVEIRGEVFCDEENFDLLTTEMESLGLEKPNSMRNIVAGILGRKENIELARFLSFKAFDLSSIDNENLDFKLESDKLERLKKNKFKIPDYTIHKNEQSINEVLKLTQEFMSEGDYLIDGVVFTYNKVELHNKLGETAHHPRYKIAFKFAGEARETIINDITWQVSRNGILTPVAEIETVEVSGANVSRVTLHNWGVVKDFELKTGDRIEIERSGEVIPKFIKVVEASNNEFIKPVVCPSCGTKVLEEQIRLKCVNSSCPDMNLEATKYFIKSLGIDDLSTERIREMFDKKVLLKTADIFNLRSDILVEKLEGYKEKLAQKVVKNIQESKQVDLLKFLVALGISGGGKTKCEKLLEELNLSTLNEVLNLSIEQISEVEGFAQKSSERFVESLNDNALFIKELLAAGVEVLERIKIEKGSSLDGHSFCITGTLQRPRAEIQNWIKSQGGKITSSVSAKTSYLVCNEESSSSKYTKAIKLGVSIITEDQLYSMDK